MSTNMMANRLINEKSPYLLQHAHNPVDWYPWCDEAFQKAESEDKPVFLSIGYSTCHWCHVMAHESFEDPAVADMLNREFVAVKVDREERPDVDAVYMTVCQALTGQGGWPLTIIMTPEKKPFFAGTYFPKRRRYSMPGLTEILNSVAGQWKTDKTRFERSGDSIVHALAKAEAEEAAKQNGGLTGAPVDEAFSMLKNVFDTTYGGFGHAPKFPAPHQLLFLLRYHHVHKDAAALNMAETTLTQMYRGGLFDHVGGGFSRYSTDEKWLVPHFEKMLYDNALLAIAYLEAYQITKNELYRTVAERTLAYVLREMTGEEGGFCSAQDADSEGVEGKFYVFDRPELIGLLGEDDGAYFCAYYGVTENGNFEGKSIPNLIENPAFAEPDERIDRLRAKVFGYRSKRTALHKDDKVLTAWNALMVAAFAKAYAIIGNEKYLSAAKRAEAFIAQYLADGDRLFVRYRDGEAAHRGNLDDYAFSVWALLELYACTFDASYLEKALRFNQAALDLFWDDRTGGFFLFGEEGERLIHRPKERTDGAMPSGNSVMAYNLLRLARLTGGAELEDLSRRQLETYAGEIGDYPVGYCFYLSALLYAFSPSQEIVCAAADGDDLRDLREFLKTTFLPHTAVLVKNGDRDPINGVAGFVRDYGQKNGKTTYYVCSGNACSEPFGDAGKLPEKLAR